MFQAGGETVAEVRRRPLGDWRLRKRAWFRRPGRISQVPAECSAKRLVLVSCGRGSGPQQQLGPGHRQRPSSGAPNRLGDLPNRRRQVAVIQRCGDGCGPALGMDTGAVRIGMCPFRCLRFIA